MKNNKLLKILLGTPVLTIGLSPILFASSCAQSEVYYNDKVNSSLPIASTVQKVIDNIDWHYGYNIATVLSNLYSQSLGWRLAGSEAEHEAAQVIESWMKQINLETEVINVPVDTFNFYSSELGIKNTNGLAWDFLCHPAPYQLDGTLNDNGIAETWELPLIDCGDGTRADWPESTPEGGYIALVSCDQLNRSWIDSYIRFASIKGAKALVTYSDGGFAAWDIYQNFITDVCAGDSYVIPTVSISKFEAECIKSYMNNKKVTISLKVDAKVKHYDNNINDSYSSIVTGRIKGKKSDGKQIVVGAHYDKYWNGFQDDSISVAALFCIANAMQLAGYKPEHDIVFVATGAEEWARIDSQFDWAGGAWGLLDQKPNWVENTLLAINLELPAFYTDDAHKNSVEINSILELKDWIEDFITSGLCVTNNVGILKEVGYEINKEDGIAYRNKSIPTCLCASASDEWFPLHYHTISDDSSTFNSDVYVTNMNWLSALLIYADFCPSIGLNISGLTKQLRSSLDESLLLGAGVSQDLITNYKKLLDGIEIESNNLYSQIIDNNNKYFEAVKKNDLSQMNNLIIEGEKLNKKIKNLYKIATSIITVDNDDTSLLITNDNNVFYGHKPLSINIESLNGMIDAIQRKDVCNKDQTGLLNYASSINSEHESAFIYFDGEVGMIQNSLFSNSISEFQAMWGYKRQLENVEVIEENIDKLGLMISDIAYKYEKKQNISQTDWNGILSYVEKAKEIASNILIKRINQEIYILNLINNNL